MKKNYRTYAMTCILLTCSVTALAAAFAQKGRYDGMVHFRNTYTFQLVSSFPNMGERAKALIEKDNELEYSSEIECFLMDGSHFSHNYPYGILAFSGVKKLAQDAGLDFPYDKLEDDEVIRAGHLYLLSFITDNSDVTVDIDGKTYRQIDDTAVPYLGYMQERQSYYIVNDKVYAELLESYNDASPYSEEMYIFNYRIKDIYNFAASKEALDAVVGNNDEGYTGRVAIDPNSDDIEWIKVEYSLCVFMFMVFVMAGGSILFMKLYNDAFDEKERYAVLDKIGVAKKPLGRAVSKELRTAYAMPFLLMVISSYFSVHSLEKMMSTDLRAVNIASVGVIFACFAVFYKLSVIFYRKNVGID